MEAPIIEVVVVAITSMKESLGLRVQKASLTDIMRVQSIQRVDIEVVVEDAAATEEATTNQERTTPFIVTSMEKVKAARAENLNASSTSLLLRESLMENKSPTTRSPIRQEVPDLTVRSKLRQTLWKRSKREI